MTPPVGTDPRELALQLAVIVQRLDERSAWAVERVEAAGAALQREAVSATHALAAERSRIASLQQSAAAARIRLLWIASIGLLAGALVAIAGAVFAVASAKRELASLSLDQTLLQAVNTADLILCGDRLCARVESGEAGMGVDGKYHPVAAR